MAEFRITKHRLMKHSEQPVLLFSIWAVIAILVIFSTDSYPVIFYGLFFTFLVVVMPIAILNFSYYMHDRHTKIARSGNTFRYTTSKVDFEFSRSDIREMTLYRQNLKGIHDSGVLPWKNYFYIELILKDQRRLILTSMLFDHSSDLDLPVKTQHTAYPLLPLR